MSPLELESPGLLTIKAYEKHKKVVNLNHRLLGWTELGWAKLGWYH